MIDAIENDNTRERKKTFLGLFFYHVQLISFDQVLDGFNLNCLNHVIVYTLFNVITILVLFRIICLHRLERKKSNKYLIVY